jgi:hypothetical protein
MKFLIINYYWEPMVDAHAYRWPQIVRGLSSMGHSVEIITSRIEGLGRLDSSGGVQIMRVGLWSAKNSRVMNEQILQRKQLGIFRLFLRKLKLLAIRIYSHLYWPDPLWHWMPSLLLELCKRRTRGYDYIISYYPSLTAHIGAYIYVKFLSRNEIYWIADYGDPFSVSHEWSANNKCIYQRINYWMDSKIYSGSNVFAVMNDETFARYSKLFNGSSRILKVNHLAPEMPMIYSRKQSKTLTLVYVGSFHKQVRDHLLLFEFSKLLMSITKFDLIIELYGPIDYWLGIELPANVRLNGKVSRDKAIGLLCSADLLINVNNSTILMTPSKVVEYIATRRPIINIGGDLSKTYEPLSRYERLGMAWSFVGTKSLDENYDLEAFIDNAIERDTLSDEDLAWCLAGHSLEDILTNYNIQI